jgi:hypothetical protein
MTLRRSLLAGLALLPALLLGTVALAAAPAGVSASDINSALAAIPPLPKPVKMTFCIFDIAGNNGDIANMTRDLALDARRWNLIIDVHVYTDERIEAEDFKAGQCDGAGMSTLRAKQFNHMVGSVDAPGNLRNYDEMKTLLKLLSQPAYASLGITGRYQVVGLVPIGSIFVMVNDRQINSIEKAAGKRVVVLDWDDSESKMISAIGAQPVPADLTSFAGKFNNGQADIIAAPAMAFRPLELYKGIGTKGGIIKFPLLQATGSILIRRDIMLPKVPDMDKRIAQIQQFGLNHLDQIINIFTREEAELPPKLWISLSKEDSEKYEHMLREARIHMTKDGTYDATMMNILKRVRCHHVPGAAECTMYEE